MSRPHGHSPQEVRAASEALRRVWDQTRARWSDAVARRFEQWFWTDYERLTNEYLSAYAELVSACDVADRAGD